MSCRCAPSLLTLVDQVNRLYPNRDNKPPTTSDGCCGDPAHAARKSDHNPDSSGFAHAQDIDEDLGIPLGSQPLWPFVSAFLADDRSKYAIYERRLMYPDGTNVPYTGPNAHEHHLHLSIKANATHNTALWKVPNLNPTTVGAPMQILYKCGTSSTPSDIGKVYVTDLIVRRHVDDTAELAFLESVLGKARENYVPAQLHDSLRPI